MQNSRTKRQRLVPEELGKKRRRVTVSETQLQFMSLSVHDSTLSVKDLIRVAAIEAASPKHSSLTFPQGNELYRNYLQLADIINNKLIREKMVGEPEPQEYYHILDSNEALRLAAECLFRHFNAPFLLRLGPKTVNAWSRSPVLPAVYFDIIKEAIQYKPKPLKASPAQAQDSTVDAVQEKLETLKVSGDHRAWCPNATERILQELNGVSAVDILTRGITVEQCLVPPQSRLNAIFVLYCTARQSNKDLQTVHHESGFKMQNVIDIALDMEIWSLMGAVNASPQQVEQWKMYDANVMSCNENLKDALKMKEHVLQLVEKRAMERMWAKQREQERIEAMERSRLKSGGK